MGAGSVFGDHSYPRKLLAPICSCWYDYGTQEWFIGLAELSEAKGYRLGFTERSDRRSFRRIDDLEDFLRTEVKIAQLRREAADREFWQLSADVFSSDHDAKVRQAAFIQTVARRSLLQALERLNDFLTSGTIPEDLNLGS
jgi:hypothetical protein